MEIRASSSGDLKEAKAFAQAYNYISKRLELYIALTIISGILLVLNIIESIIEYTPFNQLSLIFFVFLLCLMILIRLANMGKLIYRNTGKFADMHTDYIFNPFGFSYSFTHGSYRGDMVCGYDMLNKVVELDDYFVIFHRKNAAHVIDKSTLTGGTVEDLRAMLSAAFGKNYITHFKKSKKEAA